MKQSIGGVAVLALLAAGPAAGQGQRQGQGQGQGQAQRGAEAQQLRARQNIAMMEGVLEQAVLQGADNLLRQVASVMPDAAMLSGQPRVRGFRLDDYGLVFDVEIPALRLSIAWTMQSLQSGSALAGSTLSQLRAIANRVDVAERQEILRHVERLELALGVLPATLPRAARGNVSAANTLQPLTASGAQAAILPPPPAAAVMSDPDEAFTREVKGALVDAMLNYSSALGVANDEWLTLAAKDNLPADPLVPGDRASFSTILFRVKGSDLAALHAKRITLDEARKRVEVTEQ
jgi:hypothetical protein